MSHSRKNTYCDLWQQSKWLTACQEGWQQLHAAEMKPSETLGQNQTSLCITSILSLIGWNKVFSFCVVFSSGMRALFWKTYFSTCFQTSRSFNSAWWCASSCLARETFLHSVMFGSSSRGRLSSDHAGWRQLRSSLQGLAPPPCRNWRGLLLLGCPLSLREFKRSYGQGRQM